MQNSLPHLPSNLVGLSDRELIDLTIKTQSLTARASATDRIKLVRLTHELSLRLQRRVLVEEMACTESQCKHPALAGQDVSIDGDAWAGSPLESHTRYCPHYRVFM